MSRTGSMLVAYMTVYRLVCNITMNCQIFFGKKRTSDGADKSKQGEATVP